MKITGKISLLSIALATLLACAPSARADNITYTLLYNGEDNIGRSVNFAATLTFTASPLSGSTYFGTDVYGITHITGTTIYNGITYTVNEAVNYDKNASGNYVAANYVVYDNLYYADKTYQGLIFDDYGMMYTTENGNAEFSIDRGDESGTYYLEYDVGTECYGPCSVSFYLDSVTEDASPSTPEPSTWMLLASGLFALAGLAWKSRVWA